MARNPNWTRDELILALDLYFRVNPLHTSEKHPSIQELSDLLNDLPVHLVRPDGLRFRNPNGVYMKLCNFLRLDPTYKGTGLLRGGQLEPEIWREFADDRPRLEATAGAIRLAGRLVTAEQVAATTYTDEKDEFAEGRVLTALHKRRERSTTAVRQKKKMVLGTTGCLECEVCGFDFEKAYGELGTGFAECHHTVPLSQLGESTRTRLCDLAIVCANCHRILHRSRPMLAVKELESRLLVSQTRGGSRRSRQPFLTDL